MKLSLTFIAIFFALNVAHAKFTDYYNETRSNKISGAGSALPHDTCPNCVHGERNNNTRESPQVSKKRAEMLATGNGAKLVPANKQDSAN